MTKGNTMSPRQEFEELCRTKKHCDGPPRSPHGYYLAPRVEDWWQGFCMARGLNPLLEHTSEVRQAPGSDRDTRG